VNAPDSKPRRPAYRPNVGMVILNRDGRVLWAKRKDMDAWQFPQGGIRREESPKHAMLRELREETGIPPDRVEILAKSRGWIRYVIPEQLRRGGKYVGQRQKWFLLRLDGPDSLVDLAPQTGEPPEFDDWRWEDPAVAIAQAVEFKRQAYAKALRQFAPIIRAGAAPG